MGVEGIYDKGAGTLKQALKLKFDDDVIDRWHRAYTCVIFIIFAMILSTSTYVGKPMICWPQPYSGVRQDYIDTICWIKNTYWLPLREYIPHDIEERENKELNYYQWVPLILLLQAFFFYIPNALWRGFNRSSGINITAIMGKVSDDENIQPDARETTIKFLGEHIDRCLEFQRSYENEGGLWAKIKEQLLKVGCLLGRRSGNFLFMLYMIVKVFYLVNVYMQLYVLNVFLETSYYIYGIDLAIDIMAGRDWKDTGRFPRVTMCDFEIRVLGNLHRHTCQCVLPINLFNEKVYIFIWFWLFFLAMISTLNFFIWLKRMALPYARHVFLKKYLQILSSKTRNNKEQAEYFEKDFIKQNLAKFSNEHLRVDGVFVLRLVALNTSDLMAVELTNKLWQLFAAKVKAKENHRKGDSETDSNGSSDSRSGSDTLPKKFDHTISDDK